MTGAAAQLEPIPDKLVVLTFDDSKASHYTVVRPLLKKYGFGATFFITEGFHLPDEQGRLPHVGADRRAPPGWVRDRQPHAGPHGRVEGQSARSSRSRSRRSTRSAPRTASRAGLVRVPGQRHRSGRPFRFWRSLASGLRAAAVRRSIRTRKATAWPTSRAAIIRSCSRRQATPVRSGRSRT